jgi:hypothetical protein
MAIYGRLWIKTNGRPFMFNRLVEEGSLVLVPSFGARI